MQMNAVECGAASLAMILNYYGHRVSLSQVRDVVMASGRDGISAQGIAKAARTFQLRVRAYSTEPSQFPYVQLPAIVHWNFNHFVVVEKWTPSKVHIVDPAGGRRELTAAEFDNSFTGVVLTFEPNAHFKRSRVWHMSTWRTYFQFLSTTKGLRAFLAQIFAASLLLQLLGLALPVFTQLLVDRIVPYRMTEILPIIGLGLLIVAAAHMVTQLLRSLLLIYLQTRLDSQMMLGFFEHLLSLPFRFFQQRTSGDLLMRLGSNSIIREVLTSQTLSIILDGLFVVVYLVILLSYSALFGALVLVTSLAQLLALYGLTRAIKNLTDREIAAQSEAQSYMVETLAGIKMIKASGSEAFALDHWTNLFFKQLNASFQRNYRIALINAIINLFRTFVPLVYLWIGAVLVINGSMSLGTMLALNALAVSFLTPLASLMTTGQQLQMVSSHLDRLVDVLQAEPEQRLESVREPGRLTGTIQLEQVSFQYDPGSPMVLHDINLSIQAGQKIALVGATGSGKSTLAMLILGLYAPTNGQVRFDGAPLPELNMGAVRRQIGVVLQEPFIFSGSIRQNISLGNTDLSMAQIAHAAQLAHIHDDIVHIPMAYETRLAEGGTGLSGGQRQRLALARALASEPSILLLDEATSHLDAITESIVDRNLSRLSCTRIVIAHRLSTVQNADLILVLDKGRIVERGTHTELLAQGGHYAALVESQTDKTGTFLQGAVAQT
jgi:ATP-binding cassette, subfamily B, bacterial